MNSTYDFAMSKGRLILLAICLAACGISLFGAGMVSAFLLERPAGELQPPQLEARLPASRKKVASMTKPSEAKAAAKPASEASAASTQAAESGKIASGGSPPPGPSATNPQLPDAAVVSALATAKPEQQNGLLVQVAWFSSKVHADRMADALKRQGFAPISVTDASVERETRHIVQIGPYSDWDSASQAAAEIDKAFAVRTQLVTAMGRAAN
jgi:hypothetical protein